MIMVTLYTLKLCSQCDFPDSVAGVSHGENGLETGVGGGHSGPAAVNGGRVGRLVIVGRGVEGLKSTMISIIC